MLYGETVFSSLFASQIGINLLDHYNPPRSLRSVGKYLLEVPRLPLKVAAPRL